MFWLNADTPTRIWKLHREGCLFCRPEESKAKGVGAMRGSGGWFSFKTVEEAYVFYESQRERYIWQPCKICKPDKLARACWQASPAGPPGLRPKPVSRFNV